MSCNGGYGGSTTHVSMSMTPQCGDCRIFYGNGAPTTSMCVPDSYCFYIDQDTGCWYPRSNQGWGPANCPGVDAEPLSLCEEGADGEAVPGTDGTKLVTCDNKFVTLPVPADPFDPSVLCQGEASDITYGVTTLIGCDFKPYTIPTPPDATDPFVLCPNEPVAEAVPGADGTILVGCDNNKYTLPVQTTTDFVLCPDDPSECEIAVPGPDGTALVGCDNKRYKLPVVPTATDPCAAILAGDLTVDDEVLVCDANAGLIKRRFPEIVDPCDAPALEDCVIERGLGNYEDLATTDFLICGDDGLRKGEIVHDLHFPRRQIWQRTLAQGTAEASEQILFPGRPILGGGGATVQELIASSDCRFLGYFEIRAWTLSGTMNPLSDDFLEIQDAQGNTWGCVHNTYAGSESDGDVDSATFWAPIGVDGTDASAFINYRFTAGVVAKVYTVWLKGLKVAKQMR